MKKYWHVINIGIQNTLVYRVNFLFRAVFGLIPLIAIVSVWCTIYSGQQGEISGYNIRQMISYYLAVTILDALTAVAEYEWHIDAVSNDGSICQFMLERDA